MNSVSQDFSSQVVAIDFDPFASGELLLTAPSTESQKEIWASVNFDSHATCAFNESQIIHLTGELDVEALELSLQHLGQRHEALRTTFSPDGKTLCIATTFSIEIPYIDLSDLSQPDRVQKLNELAKQEVEVPFDLENGPLVRAKIVKQALHDYLLILSLHHIICDGWSWTVLFKDLSKLYSSLRLGISPSLGPSERFSDYALSEKERVNTPEFLATEEYWLNQYSDTIPTVDFPTDRPRPLLRTFRAAREDRQIDPDLVLQLKRLAKQNGCSFTIVLLAGLEIWLSRLTQQQDIVVGISAAGQSVTGYVNLVGHCVHLLPLRSNIISSQTFTEYLHRRRTAILDAYEYQQLTFGSLIQKLSIVRDSRRIPLIPITFNLDQDENEYRFTGLDLKITSNPRSFENFEIFINACDRNGELILECQFNTNLFDVTTIRRRLGEFETLLKGIADNSDLPIALLSILDLSDNQLLSLVNNTKDHYRNSCIHELFQEQAHLKSNETAVVFYDQKISYHELNRRSNMLAHYLQSLGVGPDVLVGLCIERSINMVIALFGILKAGGAYVPLNPDVPEDRLLNILSDSSTNILISGKNIPDQLISTEIKLISLDLQWEVISKNSDLNPVSLAKSTNLAYVLYTSGTSGQPKGVMIEHHSVINLATGLFRTIYENLNGHQLRVSLNGSIAFDTSVKQLIQLIYGHSIDIIPEMIRFDGSALLDYIVQHKIDVFDCTPSQLRLLLDAGLLDSKFYPKCVIVGGEPIDEEIWQKLKLSSNVKFFNVYGPTECTVDTTVYCINSESLSSPVIGKPIINTTAHILDSHLQPLPPGVPGELCIGGAGLARGYLNNPQLTAEKFICHPGLKFRIYKTGDAARILSDGNIEFLGRIDNQVKIRGYRVELGEIESALIQYPGIDQAIVIARTGKLSQKELVAYLILNQDQQFTPIDLRSFLLRILPEYMIPSSFAFLDTFPLTFNGKINYNLLPEHQLSDQLYNPSYLPARDFLEHSLTMIWGKVLDSKLIGVRDNFFELGGHSLLMVQLISEIEKVFHHKLSLGTIFQNPTIEQLANKLRDDNLSYPWHSLVPIQACGSRPPLFGIHLLRFQKLSKYLGSDQPFYGLRFGLASQTSKSENISLPHRIEDLAALYVDEIRSIQPHGPYFLIGLSLGGVIAYEVAQQLIDSGAEVALLAVCDTYIVQPMITYYPIRQQLLNSISLLSQPKALMQKLLRRIQIPLYKFKYPQGYVPSLEPPHGEASFFDLYIPKPYPSNVVFFKAESGVNYTRYYASHPEPEWFHLVQGKFEVNNIPGGHISILDEPNVKLLAEQLTSYIENIIS